MAGSWWLMAFIPLLWHLLDQSLPAPAEMPQITQSQALKMVSAHVWMLGCALSIADAFNQKVSRACSAASDSHATHARHQWYQASISISRLATRSKTQSCQLNQAGELCTFQGLVERPVLRRVRQQQCAPMQFKMHTHSMKAPPCNAVLRSTYRGSQRCPHQEQAAR